MKSYDMLIIDERKNLEKKLLSRVFNKKNTKIIELPRSGNGKICAFTPSTFDKLVEGAFVSFAEKNYYNYLSRKIHKAKNERNKIEKEILSILGVKKPLYPHLFFISIDSHDKYVDYCNRKAIKIVKKHIYNRALNLIKKWRRESNEFHYSLTPAEKIKMKKLTVEKI